MIAGLWLLALSPHAAPAQDAPQSARPANADAPGFSKAKAIKVRSVDAEYAWLKAHGLRPEAQSLIVERENVYDRFDAVDPVSGEHHQIWFDISSFYGKLF